MRRLGAVLVIVLGVIVSGAAAAPAHADRKIKIVSHNTDGGSASSAVAAAGDWGDVDAITYQELCTSERDALRAAGYEVYWAQQRKGSATRCRKGTAIVSARDLGAKVVKPLITRGSRDQRRTFKLLCAQVKGTGVANTWVCTAHFPLDYNGGKAPTGTQNRIAVARKITATINPWIRSGRRVVMTGDFNDQPGSQPLDRFYRVNGGGQFWEGDQKKDGRLRRDMEPTTSKGSKIDYFFASHRGVDPRSGVSKLPVPEYDPSGHYVVRGSVVFNPLR